MSLEYLQFKKGFAVFNYLRILNRKIISHKKTNGFAVLHPFLFCYSFFKKISNVLSAMYRPSKEKVQNECNINLTFILSTVSLTIIAKRKNKLSNDCQFSF